MRDAEGNAYMHKLAGDLTVLYRTVLNDETALVTYLEEPEYMRLEASSFFKDVSVWGDNGKAALFDFVKGTIPDILRG